MGHALRGARGLAGLVLLLGWPAGLAGQEAPPPPAPLESDLFERTGVSLVLLDVEVVDKRGRPMPGLTLEDFSVVLDGRSRPIYSLDDLCPVGPDDDDEARSGPTTPDRASATAGPLPADLMRFVLYFDFSQLRQDGRARAVEAASRWVRETLRAGELAQVVAYADRGGLRELTPFTSDKPTLLSAIDDAYHDVELIDTLPDLVPFRSAACCLKCSDPGTPPRCCTVCCPEPVDECRRWTTEHYQFNRHSLNALRTAVRALEDIPGRKAVLLFHQQASWDPAKYYGRESLDHMLLLEKVGAEATTSRAAIYPADTSDRLGNALMPWLDGPGRNFGANLADFSGGSTNRDLTDLDELIDSAGRRRRCVYRIGLKRPERSSDGRIFTAVIRVQGRVLPHRHRIQFLDDRDRWWRSAQNVLRNPDNARDIDIAAAIVPLRSEEGRWDLKVLVAIESSTLEALPEGGGTKSDWEVGALLVRNGGGQSWEMLGVSQLTRGRRNGSPAPVVHEQVFEKLRPGNYELRAFARDRWSGRFGGAHAELELPAPAQDGIAGPVALRPEVAYVQTSLPMRRKGKPASSNQGKPRSGSLPLPAGRVVRGEAVEFLVWACAGKHPESLNGVHRFVTLDGEALFRFEDPVPAEAGACAVIGDRLDTAPLGEGLYAYHVLWTHETGGEPQRAALPFRVAQP